MVLDNLNWAIIEELQKNARITFAELGRKIGLSAPAVAERVQRLEEDAVIKSFGVAIDWEKLGFLLQALISVKIRPGLLSKFLNLVPKFNEVRECYRITGDNCLQLKVMVKNPGDLEKFIDKLYEYGEPNTSIILSTPVENRILSKPSI